MANYPTNTYPQPPAYYGQYPIQQRGITIVAQIAESELDTYPVAAGNTALLMNFESGKFWLKATDVYGRPLPIEPYVFARAVPPQQMQQSVQNPQTPQTVPQNQNEYVKKEDFDKVVTSLTELATAFDGLYKELKG